MFDTNSIMSQYLLEFDIGDKVRLNESGLNMNAGKQIIDGTISEIILKKNPKPSVYYNITHKVVEGKYIVFSNIKLPKSVLEKI